MTNIVLKTDQTGANDPIYSGYPRIFNFSTTKNYNVASGIFSMKKGSTSTDGVTATIYNSFNGSGTAIASVFIATDTFNQTYTDMLFDFSNYSLSDGDYSMVLSSNTGSGGSSNYFIKSGNFQIFDQETNQIIITGIGLLSTITSTATLTANAQQGFNNISSGGASANGSSNIDKLTHVFASSEGIIAGGLVYAISGTYIVSNGGTLVSGLSINSMEGQVDNEEQQDVFAYQLDNSGRDHWGLTQGIHKRLWSPKIRNKNVSRFVLKNSHNSD